MQAFLAVSCLKAVAARCSALQCVAVRCSALQCVAVRCSALQCVAMCGIKLQESMYARRGFYLQIAYISLQKSPTYYTCLTFIKW